MSDRIENLLEQILVELKTLNSRSEVAAEDYQKQKASVDDALSGLMSVMPDSVKQAFKGGQ